MSDDRVFAKCAWRLIPFMALLYLVNYIDRVNVGYAALTMNKELGLSPSQFGFGAGIFFFSYALSQVPASLMVARIGPCATPSTIRLHMPQMPSRQSESNAMASLPLTTSPSLTTSSISRNDMSGETWSAV